MSNWSHRYKTAYMDDETLERFIKEKEKSGKSNSDIIKELMKDGWEYRRRVSEGDWHKKGE